MLSSFCCLQTQLQCGVLPEARVHQAVLFMDVFFCNEFPHIEFPRKEVVHILQQSKDTVLGTVSGEASVRKLYTRKPS